MSLVGVSDTPADDELRVFRFVPVGDVVIKHVLKFNWRKFFSEFA